jgi:predicted dehydrogenase
MSTEKKIQPSRREFLQVAGGLAAATALTGFRFPNVHPDGSDLIQVACVGCGGRGSGAIVNALSTTSGPIKLVAMADTFADRLNDSYTNVSKASPTLVDVPPERRFLGFDAYKQAMDCLKPGDIVILTTPPAFRWVHFQYAISKKLNVFMEKPVTVDGPSSRKMLKLADEAAALNLKVGVGLMSRHAPWLQQLHDRVQSGKLGEIILMRGYRMHGPAATFESTPKPAGVSDLEYQIRRFHSFLWASGGCFNDFYIHIIDQGCWMKNALPVTAQAVGGRHYKASSEGLPFVDQNLDTYSVEYTFPDGTKFFFDGRCVEGAHGIFSSFLHGTKGVAVASRSGDCGGPSAIYKGQNMTPDKLIWQSTDKSNPYQNEWDVLVKAIRGNKPFNEAKRGINASLVSSMGRMAAHTGQEITFDQMLNSDHEFGVGVDTLKMDSPSPLMPEANGRYPVPMPGMKTREY